MFQMQDLPQAILAALASATGPLSSLELASKLSCDVQKVAITDHYCCRPLYQIYHPKVVGAVKSLEVLEGYIETEMVAAKRSTSIVFFVICSPELLEENLRDSENLIL